MTKTRVLFGIWITFLILAWVKPVGAQGATIHRLSITGPITPAMISYFERGIGQAEREGAEALVIELDTPGGQSDLMLQIIQAFRAARVPIIVFITPRGAQAASAGTFITLAAHVAVMSPETTIGAASPVDSGGQDLGETMERKLKEDFKATVRALAERRGEEAVALAEATVEEAKAVHAREALAAGLIDFVAEDLTELLEMVDGLTVMVNGETVVLSTAAATVLDSPPSLIEKLLHVVVNPNVITILLAIGIQAILIELSSPGGWFAGFLGVVCVGLALYGYGLLPVNWFGMGLVALALVLFILDIKAPTHGALTAAGILTLIAGFLITFNYPGSPESTQVSVPLVVGIALMIGAFFAFVLVKVLQARKRTPSTGREALIGATAEVRRPLTPEGSVFVGGERWKAISDDGSEIPTGTLVKVISMEGFRLRVSPQK